MTDPSSDQPPIVVSNNPTKVTLEAFLRQLLTVGGIIAGGLGFTRTAGAFSTALLALGPLITTGAMAWGLVRTYIGALKSKKMANLLDDKLAHTK